MQMFETRQRMAKWNLFEKNNIEIELLKNFQKKIWPNAFVNRKRTALQKLIGNLQCAKDVIKHDRSEKLLCVV